MSLSFPRTMPTVGIKSQSFELQRSDYLSPEKSGRLGAVAGGWPLWATEIDLNNLMPDNADIWRAWIAAQRGAQRQFYGFDVDRRIPRAYQSGGSYTHDASSWSVNSDRDVVTLNGLTAAQVITLGDYIGFSWAGIGRAIVRAVETITADGSGVATVTVEPAVHTLVPSTAVATVYQPTCLMRLVPGTQMAAQDIGYTVAGTKIQAVQDLVSVSAFTLDSSHLDGGDVLS